MSVPEPRQSPRRKYEWGNPDGATPPHIVEKLCTVAQRPDTHGYSTSRGIPRLRRAISR
ncbi:hypothetical protein NMW07_23765, partial [Escherichia coli]|nr:hypothetical protein [Escherichia coli]